MSLTTTIIMNKTFKMLMYSNTLVMISEMAGYRLYILCLWNRHISMGSLSTNLANFQADNTTEYVKVYFEIQEHRYID